MASFDDLGKIAPSAWVLEQGRYALYVGTSVREAAELDWAWEQVETEVTRTVSDSLSPSHLPKRLLADGGWEEMPPDSVSASGAAPRGPGSRAGPLLSPPGFRCWSPGRQPEFDRPTLVLVLNVGGVMDVSWFCEDDRIPSVLLAYQGGMEGGAAVAALLTGRTNPCGKLPDTFARDLSDYPSTEPYSAQRQSDRNPP